MSPQPIFAFVNNLWAKVIYLNDMKITLVFYLYFLYSLNNFSSKKKKKVEGLEFRFQEDGCFGYCLWGSLSLCSIALRIKDVSGSYADSMRS